MIGEHLGELCVRLAAAKAKEEEAKIQRIEAEEGIAAILGIKEEGTVKRTVWGYSVTVTTKLTRTLDYEVYRAIEDGIPEGVRCVDMKPSLNLKKLRALEMVDPSLPAMFITTKPAKASVKLEVVE